MRRQQVASLPSILAPAPAALAFACIALASTEFRSASSDHLYLVLAIAAAAATVLAAAFVPWRSLPAPALLALPLACDMTIALLRQGHGGNQSGYGALLVLPVLWVAFVVGRVGVVVLVAVTAATVMAPIAIVGGAEYPSTAWRGAVLLTLVAAIAGAVTERGVARVRLAAQQSEDRASLLDRLVRTHTALAISDFGLDDLLETVVDEALDLTGADAAVVEVPEQGEMVYRAVAGAAAPFAGTRLPTDASASGRCMQRMEPVVIPDTELDEHIDSELCRRIGARSMVLVPLIHAGRAAGGLKVYSAAPGAVGADDARVLGLLGNAIGSGLARAELLATMEQHAHTDSLTGLANRRSWDEHLERAIAHSVRTNETLSVAVCDLDGLKRVNDNEGHAAGDALIREVAHRWRAEARASDVVARIGGDEFALLLPGADEVAAADVVRRLADALPPGRTVSVGVAEWDLRETAASLMARADARMYAAKRRDRSRAPATR